MVEKKHSRVDDLLNFKLPNGKRLGDAKMADLNGAIARRERELKRPELRHFRHLVEEDLQQLEKAKQQKAGSPSTTAQQYM